ncbi:MAG: hypothetical protein GX998_06060 [Firmicutes bacterium]|nr:hypothetical protein [Bacillota bacterium]
MVKRTYLVLVILSCLICFPTIAAAQSTVAVMPFEGHEIRNWYIDRDQMITGITESLTDRLAELEGVRVVERGRLLQIIQEQDFGYSGRVDLLSAAEIGRLLGADLLVMGTVTAIDMNESGGIQLGPIGARSTTARVNLSARIVNTETGEIIGSVQSSGKHSGASISVHNLMGVSFQSDTFKNSVLGQALTKSVSELVEEFEEVYAKWDAPGEELAGNILAVIEDKYVLNLGSVHGVTRGDRFAVFQLVKVAGLSSPVEIPMGSLRIISVDAEASVAEAEDAVFEVGYVVRKQ